LIFVGFVGFVGFPIPGPAQSLLPTDSGLASTS
jgi:hypothetical protein